jgi:tetratricopeptide (TPR) repeat protein
MQVKNYFKGIEFLDIMFEKDGNENEETLFAYAWFQFHSWDYQNCIETLNSILSVPEYHFASRQELVSANDETTFIQIPLFAVCLNMRGVCHYQLGNVAQAKLDLKRAIELFPNYIAAIENLRQLEINSIQDLPSRQN